MFMVIGPGSLLPPLDEQWGDDWDDVPFEHNAGEPYHYAFHFKRKPYNLVKVAWEGPFILPSHEHTNSPFSVEMINRGDVAWLRPDSDFTNRYPNSTVYPIIAGTSLPEFVKLIQKAGGLVYILTGTIYK